MWKSVEDRATPWLSLHVRPYQIERIIRNFFNLKVILGTCYCEIVPSKMNQKLFLMICGIRVWLVIDFLLFHLSFALSNDFFQFFVIFFQFYIPLYFLCCIAFVHFRQCKSTLSVKLILGKNGSTFLASANGFLIMSFQIIWMHAK